MWYVRGKIAFVLAFVAWAGLGQVASMDAASVGAVVVFFGAPYLLWKGGLR